MSDRPWYKRYGADFVLSTMSLSLEEKGAFSICIDMIYDRSGPIPDDARWLAGLCNISLRKWGIIRAALLAKGKLYVADDGGLMNYRARKTLENPSKTPRKADENAAKTKDNREINGVGVKKNSNLQAPRAGARANTHTRHPEARGQIESTLANASVPTPADDEPLGEPPKPREKVACEPKVAARGTRLSTGWTPSREQIDKALEIAKECGVQCDEKWVIWIAQRFHDYWVAQPGQRGVRLDWDAVWRNWIRREFEQGSGRHGPRAEGSRAGGGRNERDDRVGAMLEGAREALDRRR